MRPLPSTGLWKKKDRKRNMQLLSNSKLYDNLKETIRKSNLKKLKMIERNILGNYLTIWKEFSTILKETGFLLNINMVLKHI